MKIPFYIGTYTAGLSRGIHRAVLDTVAGQVQDLQLAAEVDNPSFLTLHPTLPILYSCREIRRDGRREGSQLMAFLIDMHGQLSLMGGQASGGSGPCYVSIDRTGKVALVSNYGSGSIASFPIADDGSLGAMASNIQHVGQSVNPDRQSGPHAHCIMPDPSNRFACAVDLGLDQVLSYALDPDSAKLSAQPVARFHAQPGQGPRHIAFHPDGQHAFIINEMGNTITTCRCDSQAGSLTAISNIDTLPTGFTGESTTAEIMVHPSGRFLVGSNRGHDSLVVYSIAQALKSLAAGDQPLTLVQHLSTGGKTPRNFRIDPTGQFVVVANQDSDSLVVMKIDQQTGHLTTIGQPITVGSPCCIKFVQ